MSCGTLDTVTCADMQGICPYSSCAPGSIIMLQTDMVRSGAIGKSVLVDTQLMYQQQLNNTLGCGHACVLFLYLYKCLLRTKGLSNWTSCQPRWPRSRQKHLQGSTRALRLAQPCHSARWQLLAHPASSNALQHIPIGRAHYRS